MIGDAGVGHRWAWGAVLVWMACLTPAVGGQAHDLSRYRDFVLGSTVAAVSTRTAVAPSMVKTRHQRPAVLRDLEWRLPRWDIGSSKVSTDPVETIAFSFYNDQLYQFAVAYDTRRTEGLTVDDMTDAISALYGTPVPRAQWPTGRLTRSERDAGTLVARWEDDDHAIALYRNDTYRPAFNLIVTQRQLESLARKAEAEAVRLDAQEAPGRDLARQRKEREDARDAAAKARTENKGAFRP